MKKRTIANGILASSVILTLGTAPFQGESIAWTGLFHVSFAAAVGGFADWFGVTSLFRRPLRIPWRTDLIAKNREMIVSIAKDMVVNELLTRGRLSEILRQHVPSDVMARWLTNHRDLTEKVAADVIHTVLSAFPEESLWTMSSEEIEKRTADIDWAGHMAQVMAAFRDYPKKELLTEALAAEVKGFLQAEVTQEEIQRVYLLAWRKYNEKGRLHSLFRDAVEDRDEAMVKKVQGKILSLSDALTDPESELRQKMGESYDAMIVQLETNEAWKRQVNGAVQKVIGRLLSGKGRNWFLSMWQKRKEPLAQQLAGTLLSLIEGQLSSPEKRRDFDAFLLRLVRPHVGWLHRMAASVVEKALSGYDGRTMASLAEKSVSEDVAAIRINGSLWGAFLGAAFFAVSLLWETLMQ
uniref:DUF445 family protein n=1 Tax=Dialister sp. TaxID=1955814 RepID=UPI003FF05AAB